MRRASMERLGETSKRNEEMKQKDKKKGREVMEQRHYHL